MRDAFEALAAQDPARPYQHGDPAALVARITADRRRARLPGRFRLAVAAAASVSGLVTVGLVAALSVAPTPPLLAFAPTPSPTPAFAATKSAQSPTTAGVAAPARPVAGRFGPDDSLASAYQLMVPESGLNATMGLGAALGVVGTIGGYNGTVFSETGTSGSRITYDTTIGIGQWRYSAGSSAGLSPWRFAAAIAKQRWGYHADIGRRTGSSPVVVDGSATTLRVTFTVHDGRVVAASGPAFIVAAMVNYRLRSPNDALAATYSEHPTVATSVALSWSLYTTADHFEWLLPTFVFHGHSGTRAWTGESLAVLSASLTGTAG